MPFFRYRDGSLTDLTYGTLDPEEVNRKFDDIARFLNGNVGADNCVVGQVLDAADMLAARAQLVIHIPVDTVLGTWPAAGTVFKNSADRAMKIMAIGVHSATVNFAASLAVSGGSTIASLSCPTTPILYDYMIYDISAGDLAVNDVVTMTVTAGSCRAIVLFATNGHI
jgi:hypothetical protein